jgi:hypothetical protein
VPTQALLGSYERPPNVPVNDNFPWTDDGWEAGLIESTANDTFET